MYTCTHVNVIRQPYYVDFLHIVASSPSGCAGGVMGRLLVYLSQSMTCSAQQFSLNTAKSDSWFGVGGILVIRPAPSPVVINALSK